MRTVGILGGMGPEATILLMQRILAATPAQDDCDHVPLLVDNNTQVPSRIRHILDGTGADPTPVLEMMARRLEAAGAAALAMPCNTAHIYADAVRSATSLPLLDMVALSADAAAAHQGGPVGLIASPASHETGIFHRAFEQVTGGATSIVYPNDRAAMLSAVRAVKAGALDGARPALIEAARELTDAGAVVLIVGCSEFSLLSRELETSVPVIDTLDVLATACVTFARMADTAEG